MSKNEIERENAQRSNHSAASLFAHECEEAAPERLLHRLQQPLAAVQAHAELLADEVSGPLNAEQRDQVQAILRGNGDLSLAIKNLFEWERLERGGGLWDDSKEDLAGLCRGVVREMSERFGRSGRGLSLRAHGPLFVRSDGLCVRGVLTRLLDNALKYTQPGDNTTVILGKARGEARVRVEDDGPGLHADELATLFQPFRRPRREKERSIFGLGLGLCVSRRMITRLGGTLRVKSGENEGFQVELGLPRS